LEFALEIRIVVCAVFHFCIGVVVVEFDCSAGLWKSIKWPSQFQIFFANTMNEKFEQNFKRRRQKYARAIRTIRKKHAGGHSHNQEKEEKNSGRENRSKIAQFLQEAADCCIN